MLDQSFTLDNLRKIFDYENRKGNYLEGLFFPEIEAVSKDIKKCMGEIKLLRTNKANMSFANYNSQKTLLEERKNKLKNKKETMLIKELEKISETICSSKFCFNVKKICDINNKPVFSVGQDAESFFAVKQLQRNLKKIYKIKQSSRYSILSNLKNILNDSFPKLIYRVDLKGFYESIPSNEVIKKIQNDYLLTAFSKKLIKNILFEYQKVSGNSKGVPRGIGISAYLSELYMKELDDKIRKRSDVAFYARYVDDIIVVIFPKPNDDIYSSIGELEDQLNNLGLSLNNEKTQTEELLNPKNVKIDYLGYKVLINSGKVTITLSNNRMEKYKKRISLVFDDYFAKSKKNEKKARKIIIKRLRFLTTNTRLLNNKKNVLVGIYFSNSLVNEVNCFDALDRFLKYKIQSIKNDILKARLNEMSFLRGFNEKTFTKFNICDLKEIVNVWKDKS